MAKTKANPVGEETPPEPGTAPLAPSPLATGPEPPATAPSGSRSPRKPRKRGLPAAPAALAGANTVAVAGGYAASMAGPVVGAAVAGGLVASAAALGLRQRSRVKRNVSRRAARDVARRNGLATNPATLRSGRWAPVTSGPSRRGPITSGSAGSGGSHRGGGGSTKVRPHSSGSRADRGGGGSTRPGSGSASVGSRSGSGSGGPDKGRGRHKAGGGSGSDLRVGPPGSRKGRDRSGSNRTESPRTRRKDRGRSESTRTPLLMSKPNRPSRARQLAGPRPGTGPRSQRGGLINRGNGTRRAPIQAAGRGLRKVSNGVQRTGRGLKSAGRGAVRAWKSQPAQAARKWSIGATRRSWGILGPAVGAALAGANAAMRRRGWREVWKSMASSWGRLRAKWGPKNGRHAKAAAAADPTASAPAATVIKPANLVGLIPSATRGPAKLTGGVTMAQARVIEASREMVGAAMMYNPQGMMDIGNDFASFPEVLMNVASAIQHMTRQVQEGETPMHPAIVDQVKALHASIVRTAHEAQDLKPAFENLHQVDINRIRNPRPNEGMWDLSANRDHVGS